MTTTQHSATELLDDQIDLRRYVQAVLKNWIWIALAMVLGAGAAAVFSFFIVRPTYEATALVAITPARYLMQFSPDFRTVDQERIQTEIYGIFPELAEGDDLLQQVSDTVDAVAGRRKVSLLDLQRSVSVQGSRDIGLIYLRVEADTPALAADIANTWADLYVQSLNRLYGDAQGDYQFFEEQLVSAQGARDQAQEALAEFKARDLSGVLQSELTSTSAALDSHLARRNQIEVLTRDLQGWRHELVAQNGAQELSLADELTAVLVQLRAFGVLEQTNLQFAIDQETLRGRSAQEQLDQLDALLSLLQAWQMDVNARIAELEPAILGIQRDLQAALNEGEQFNQETRIATSLYESLALKSEEARIALESQVGVGRLASRAAVPTEPVSPRKLFSTALGGVLGLLAGLAGVVLLELLRSYGRADASDLGSAD